ncbi:AzlD family protein [Notoacmeibacter sp. MSK16QG-6]|uniref:AzlD family protein n=1 Tax=Notoacmeibacter sp. MSK16QG-6 TaxID=2957982 RepID=UPI0021127246|nr:AzlD family protein [Notoacmeibacter sp. MSK16QG-6]
MIWIIIFGAAATYLTRIGGHLVLSRFDHVHPRVQAGLNAVPAAVLTTLVAPALIDAGPAEWSAIIFAAFVGLRAKLTGMFFASAVLLIVLRQIGFN